MNLEKNTKTLNSLYPIQKQPQLLKTETLKNLPLWVKSAIEIYEVRLAQMEPLTIYLLAPTATLTFDQIILVHKLLSVELNAPLLLIADNLPAKFRSLLVKFRIAFVFKDESIFAPELGVRFGKLKSLNAKPKIETRSQSEALSAASLKIAAGVLTGFIEKDFTLKALHEKIAQQNVKMSLSKLSNSLNELVRKNILIAQGAGPQRRYGTMAPTEIWQKLKSVELAPFHRALETNHIPQEKEIYRLAGESALSEYSNLAAPKAITTAMTAQNFRQAYQSNSAPSSEGETENSYVVQVWKEDPALFAVDSALNPVEVYFSLRNHSDERVQMALGEMLAKYHLENERGE